MSSRDLVDDLKRIIPPSAKADMPKPHTARQSIPGSRSVGQSGQSTTAGIASPLSEPDISARTFHATPLISSDGLFTMPAVKKIVMKDANGREVVFEYAQP